MRHPLSPEEIEVTLDNRYDFDFIKVMVSDDNYLDGGDQHWWPDTGKQYNDDFERYYDYVLNPDYRLYSNGCGLIAMTDLELYLSQQNGYDLPGYSKPYTDNDPIITQAEYMDFAEYNKDNYYFLTEDYWGYKLAVNPLYMSIGFTAYMDYNGIDGVEALWAPTCDKLECINVIKQMIRDYIPVVISYNTFDEEDKIYIFSNVDDAKNNVRRYSERWSSIQSHYMIVIGYIKNFKSDRDIHNYLLKVISYGRVYYLNYDVYSEHLGMFTYILEITR